MSTSTVRHPYRDRPIRFNGLRTVAGYRLKVYSITFDGRDPDPAVFDAGLRLAAEALPQPPVTESRYGVGFLIRHRGRGEDYLVLNWWDKENELFSRVCTTANDDAAGWRVARHGEAGCVWDLQVIGVERDAYIATVLSRPGPPDVDAYLRRAAEPSHPQS
jgi:hypothetical protein